MDTSDQIWRLRRLDAEGSPDEALALAAAILADAWKGARAAVEVWRGPEAKAAHNALVVLSQLGELAVAPLIEASSPRTGRERIWLLRTIAEAGIGLRAKIIARVEAALDDRELVHPPKPVGPCEEPPRPHRVCDEAYVQLRRLVGPAESEEDAVIQAWLFLKLDEAAKDAEIAKARTREFTDFTSPAAEE